MRLYVAVNNAAVVQVSNAGQHLAQDGSHRALVQALGPLSRVRGCTTALARWIDWK